RLADTVDEFEKLSHELLAKIEDRAARVKVEREAERRTAELKREAQRATEVTRKTDRSSRNSSSPGQEGGFPPQLRAVRVVRDGRVVSDGREAKTAKSASVSDERAAPAGRQDVRAPSEMRTPHVGDRVRLRTFGSVGIVDRVKDDEAFLNGLSEVRIIHGHGTGALRKAIAELLAGHPHVARFAAAPQDQGGSGATVVVLNA